MEEFIILLNILCSLFFKRYTWSKCIIRRCWWWTKHFAAKLKNVDKGKKTTEKNFFFNNLGLLFSARERFLNNFKSRLFATKNLDKIQIRALTSEVATEPTKNKKSKLKLQEEFMNEIITDEKDINNEIFLNYFKYQNQLFVETDLIRAMQAKNETLVINFNDGLINSKNAINKKEIPENENPKKSSQCCWKNHRL